MAVGIRYLLAAGALGVAMAMQIASADGQGFFDFFFQPQRHWAPRYDNQWDNDRLRGKDYYSPQLRYEPRVRVRGPQYRNYIPDLPKKVSFDKVCQFKLASNAESGPVPAEPQFAAACAAGPAPSLRVLPEVGAAINDYYSSHPRFLWIDNGEVSGKARAAMAALALSERYGLTPADYYVAQPAAATGNNTADLQTMLRFELTLSAKVVAYVLDATRGRVDPNRISDYYDLPRKKVDPVAVMGELAKTQHIIRYLDSCNPDSPQFHALVAALATARAAAAKRTINISAHTFIRPSEDDTALPQVIAAIQQSGSTALKQKHANALIAYDGGRSYAPPLVSLVRDFQREMGLNPDGIIGRNTVAAMMQAAPANHIKKLTLAMERMRWLPRQLGKRYVLLNEPAYQVTFVKGDGKSLTMRAIVGDPTHQTYFFADIIESVEYNPYWNVPRSIMINEMLPNLYNDPYYLDRQGYQVINTAGRRVSSGAVDWGAYARDRISVDVRQPPGPHNALGRLKIKFPNNHAVYMHDTPEKYLFKHQKLAFSHGCVRLEQPRVMAAALLGKPVSYIDQQIATGKNFSEHVGGNIPVYLAYFTAWPDGDGAIHYYNDIYGRDGRLSDALAKTEAARHRH